MRRRLILARARGVRTDRARRPASGEGRGDKPELVGLGRTQSQDRDDAWHFAYAVQSWAAEQSGHVVMIPARYTIVADRAFFAEEFSHIPIRALRGVRANDPDQVVVLKHLWTTHASSWDYDTDIKFVLYGPGFVKEGVRLEKTTLQNIAPTYARLIGTNPPKGSMGRVMTEALVPTSKRPKVILTIVMDGAGGRSTRHGRRPGPSSRASRRGVEYTDAKVTQLETATAVSHVAIGTGGYPFTTRIVGNEIYDPATKQVVQSFPDFSAEFIKAPTLADEYGVSSQHKAVVIGTSAQDRAGMGMVGHGAAYHPGNKNHIVVLFAQPKRPAWKEQFPGGDQELRLMTNLDLYGFPAYLRGRAAAVRQGVDRRYWRVDGAQGRRQPNVRFTPAFVDFECDNMLLMMDREPIDRARRDLPRLPGPEDDGLRRAPLGSREPRGPGGAPGAGRLRRQDGPEAERPGRRGELRNHDHRRPRDDADARGDGRPPALAAILLELIDRKFGAKIRLGGGFINLWFDQAKMKELGVTNQDIAAYLRSLTAGEYYGPREKWPTYLAYRPEQRLFFNAYTFEQVEAFVKANPSAGWPIRTRGPAPTRPSSGTSNALRGWGRPRLSRLRSPGRWRPAAHRRTGYFYRDGSELEEERETFEALTPR